MRAVVATLSLALIAATPAQAEWKPEYADADPARRQWFNSQEMNEAARARLGVPYKSCCDNGDVFRTRFRVADDGSDQWQYLEAGQWKVIPPDIIKDEPSLDNTPILFKNRHTGQELCFFKPQGGL